MGTALPTTGHLPTTMQTANRAQVPALIWTISRMLTKVLKIGRRGRKGTCKGQEVLYQLSLEGQGWARGRYWPMEGTLSLPQPRAPGHFHTGDCTSERCISGPWAFLVTAWQRALADPAMPRS